MNAPSPSRLERKGDCMQCPICSQWPILDNTGFIGDHQSHCPELAAHLRETHKAVTRALGRPDPLKNRFFGVGEDGLIGMNGLFTVEELRKLGEILGEKKRT